MKRIWDKYFYWNKRERRGVVPLLLIMFALITLNIYFRYQSSHIDTIPDADFMARAKEFNQSNNQLAENEFTGQDSTYHNNRKYYSDNEGEFAHNKKSFAKPSSPFNPNDLVKADWIKLGLSEKQASSIERFQNKGGKFYKKADLKKMYVISEDFYDNIEPFLVFPEKQYPNTFEKKTYDTPVSSSIAKMDINQADSSQLVTLKGITPKMVSKILQTRKVFGGYHSLEQVKDLFGFYEPNYPKLAEMAFAGSITIKPLNINYCTFKELMQVPGLNYDLVKTIITHREKNGSFKKTEDLVTLNLAEPDLYAKIAPYLTVK